MKRVTLVLLTFFFFSTCKKADNISTPLNPTPPTFVSYFSDTTTTKPTGLDTSSTADLQNIPYVEDLDSSRIPVFARVSSPSIWNIDVPPPGTQLYNSCVGWTVAELLGFQYKIIEGSPNYLALDRIFSPSYIWNQLNGGVDRAISFASAFNLVRNEGCCKWIYMPGNIQSFTTQPTSTASTNASNYKISEYAQFKTVDINLIKFYVSRNYPIPFGLQIDEGFQSGKDQASFSQKADGRLVWIKKSGKSIGGHAMLICGYDDNINAFKVLNSWGTGWGNDGFIWIDYSFFQLIIAKSFFFNRPEIYLVVTRKPGAQIIPALTTLPINLLTQTTVQSGGTITSDGGAIVTSRGVVWSKNQNPTVFDNKSTDGTGTGSFLSNLSNLLPSTTYYLRAYATNSIGTGYGNQIIFTTPQPTATLPTITTALISGVTQTTAQSGGIITSDGNATVIARGICWSTSANPTTGNSHTTDGNGTGTFTSSLTGLTANTTYNVRAYATNSAGTAYGNNVTFTTSQTIAGTVTDIDGNVYHTVTIGTQVWMVENLKTNHYRNGEPIQNITDASQWTNLTSGAWCDNNNDPNYATTFGHFYNWYTVIDSRNIAPLGWHIPTDAEWTLLTNFLGGQVLAGGKMKATTLWDSPNTGATNESGFMGLPGNYRNYQGAFGVIGFRGSWWSSTPGSLGFDALDRDLRANSSNITITDLDKTTGVSVRCIKD